VIKFVIITNVVLVNQFKRRIATVAKKLVELNVPKEVNFSVLTCVTLVKNVENTDVSNIVVLKIILFPIANLTHMFKICANVVKLKLSKV